MSLLTQNKTAETLFGKIRQHLSRMVRRLRLRRQIAQERRMLRTLDDRILKDIGISRIEAAFEASRSASDIPAERMPPDDVKSGNHRSRLQGTTGAAC